MNKSTSKYTKIMIGVVAILVVVLIALLVLVVTSRKASHNAPNQNVISTVEATEEKVNQDKDMAAEDALTQQQEWKEEAESEPEIATEPEVETEPEIETEPEVEGPEAGSLSYKEYLELSADMQQVYYENFQSPEEFFNWMATAKEEYQATTTPTETNPGGLKVEIGGNEEW